MSMAATLASRLAAGEVLHLPARVTHARRGGLRHGFRYGVDYLLLAPDTARTGALFARNRFNLFSLHDIDHGGRRGAGKGAAWAIQQFSAAGAPIGAATVVALLAQPRFLGFWFNPVSFWLLVEEDRLRAVIAEVNNTFGQRHSYLCRRPGFAPIGPQDCLTADKVFHVSPFQAVSGHYAFSFAIGADAVSVVIRQIDHDDGLIATMQGEPRAMTALGLLAAALRRPGGALRIVALIYWQALRLKLKGAPYRPLPQPPEQDVSR